MTANEMLENLIYSDDIDQSFQDGIDALVFDAAHRMAEKINEWGPEHQLEFLREHFSDKEIALQIGLGLLPEEDLFDSPWDWGKEE